MTSNLNTTKSKRQTVQGKKWCFLKEKDQVYTVYNHNKAIIRTSTGDDPGKVIGIARADSSSSKVVLKYSSKKQLKLSLESFYGSDDINKELYLQISDINSFINLVSERLGVSEVNLGTKKGNNPEKSAACLNANDQQDQEESDKQNTSKNSNDSSVASEDSKTVPLPEEMSPYFVDKSLAPFKVLVANLIPPRDEYKLREIDELFVKALTNEFKESLDIVKKPLLAVVKGLKSPEDFDKDLLDSYQFEVIGGNHRRVVIQRLFQENQDEKFKLFDAVLFSEMPKKSVLKIAASHNKIDSFNHILTNQEKVDICHKALIKDFDGKKSSEWRNYCAEILNCKLDSLEFILMLSGFDGNAFEALQEVFKAFEQFKVKEQKASASQAKKLLQGAVHKPNIVASKFKCLRGLDTKNIEDILVEVSSGTLSFRGMREKAERMKVLQALKKEFIKLTGMESWEECKEKFPNFTSEVALNPFLIGYKKGKTNENFKSFVQRAMKTEHINLTRDLATYERTDFVKIKSEWYCAIKSSEHKIVPSLFEGLPFGGADLIVIQNEENYNDEVLKTMIRQISGMNTRNNLTKYVIAIRNHDDTAMLTSCTPDGKGDTLFVSWNKKPKLGESKMTNSIERVGIIFIGKVAVEACNVTSVSSEQQIMHYLIRCFLPTKGTVLGIGNQAGSLTLLKAAKEGEVNFVSILKNQVDVDVFLAEAALNAAPLDDENPDDLDSEY